GVLEDAAGERVEQFVDGHLGEGLAVAVLGVHCAVLSLSVCTLSLTVRIGDVNLITPGKCPPPPAARTPRTSPARTARTSPAVPRSRRHPPAHAARRTTWRHPPPLHGRGR